MTLKVGNLMYCFTLWCCSHSLVEHCYDFISDLYSDDTYSRHLVGNFTHVCTLFFLLCFWRIVFDLFCHVLFSPSGQIRNNLHWATEQIYSGWDHSECLCGVSLWDLFSALGWNDCRDSTNPYREFLARWDMQCL